jgi:hypothetical protein
MYKKPNNNKNVKQHPSAAFILGAAIRGGKKRE